MPSRTKTASEPATRQKLIEAATELIRKQGYSATSVDQICAGAGVTKGAFFHYFDSKTNLGRAAIESWCEWGANTYLGFLGDPADDPRVRLTRLIDGMIGMTTDTSYDPLVCLLGMMAQEVADTQPELREACEAGLSGWTGMAARLVEEAQNRKLIRSDINSEEIGWFLNSVWQGSMLVAKTCRDPAIAANNLRHARDYVQSLFSEEEAA